MTVNDVVSIADAKTTYTPKMLIVPEYDVLSSLDDFEKMNIEQTPGMLE